MSRHRFLPDHEISFIKWRNHVSRFSAALPYGLSALQFHTDLAMWWSLLLPWNFYRDVAWNTKSCRLAVSKVTQKLSTVFLIASFIPFMKISFKLCSSNTCWIWCALASTPLHAVIEIYSVAEWTWRYLPKRLICSCLLREYRRDIYSHTDTSSASWCFYLTAYWIDPFVSRSARPKFYECPFVRLEWKMSNVCAPVYTGGVTSQIEVAKKPDNLNMTKSQKHELVHLDCHTIWQFRNVYRNAFIVLGRTVVKPVSTTVHLHKKASVHSLNCFQSSCLATFRSSFVIKISWFCVWNATISGTVHWVFNWLRKGGQRWVCLWSLTFSS